MHFTSLLLSAASCIGLVSMVATRDVTVPNACALYQFENPHTQAFKSDENWILDGTLKMSKGPNGITTEVAPLEIAQGKRRWTDKWWYYHYEVDAGASAHAKGELFVRVKLLDKKGEGQQFLAQFVGYDNRALATSWVWANEYCTAPQEFDSSQVATIKYYHRCYTSTCY